MAGQRSHLTRDYLKEIFGAENYDRYPDISDRKAWDGLSEELKNKLIKAGEEAGQEPWTQLLISDFLEFSKSGNRVRFEDQYFPRRRKLNKLVMAECVENKGRFLDDILDGLYLILEETTWCLPPHTSYERDGRQETLPDVSRQIIDLFQAESGAEIAFTEYLLRPAFEKVSPHISIYVNQRLDERIFKPYLGQFFWWMGDGEQTMCNWTPWIVQNILICALTRTEGYFEKRNLKTEDGNTASLRTFLEKAAVSVDYFLDEYGTDGGCNEGAQYYSHAGLCLFGCLELIDGATSIKDELKYAEIDKNGQVLLHDEQNELHNADQYDTNENYAHSFSEIFFEEKIRNIANFIVKMYVGKGYYVNFADCSPLAGRRSAREFLFGKRCGDEVLASFAASDFREGSDEEKLLSSEINLFYHVMQAFAYDEMMDYPVSSGLPEDSWFDSMGLMVARDKIYTLAAKAGNNGDSHNHNDVGSFTIYKNGRPFIIDLGVGTYTKKTFSDSRYELWTMQSQFHNLPTFLDFTTMSAQNGGACSADSIADTLGMDSAADSHNPQIIMQRDGAEFAASDVSCILCTNNTAEDKKAVSSLKMDISGAYGTSNFIYTREVSLVKGEGVTVKDTYNGGLPFTLSLMTYEKPKIMPSSIENTIETSKAKEKITNISVGDLGKITVKGPVTKALIKEYEIADERLSIAWHHNVYRTLLVCDSAGDSAECNLVIKFE